MIIIIIIIIIIILNTPRKLIRWACSTHGGSEKCKWNSNRKTEEEYLFMVLVVYGRRIVKCTHILINVDMSEFDSTGSGLGPVVESCEHNYELSGYINVGELLTNKANI
jgi:hypothetical protein